MRKLAVFSRVSILKEHHHFQSNGGDNGLCILPTKGIESEGLICVYEGS